ncbi:5-(carboxyamino)imidazole ribonucleotide mutase [Streptomyces sp. DpondAA-F4a]|nr:5-(carboxyamino)imidazole ribonucleotide mutase [Streptomyces sp. DpondAA-F4a]
MTAPGSAPVIGIVMGSDSDWPVMEAAAKALDEFEIPYEVDVVSAHRMPREMIAYGEAAAGRGLKAIIAGAGARPTFPACSPRSPRCPSSGSRCR